MSYNTQERSEFRVSSKIGQTTLRETLSSGIYPHYPATQYLSRTLAGNIVLKDTENPYQPRAAWRESYSLSSEVFQFEIKCLVHTLPNETAQLRSDIDVTVWFHWNDAK